ncbi:hypothetical protein [Actinomadura sp. 9N407]|uniref:hypothetical protein n=1 Tax=Actinomadura sp. 9N407 TaxID=3375154 RepID=UPI00379E9BCB
MTAGTVVTAPDGTQVTLAEIGQTVLLDNDAVRIWEVVLDAQEIQPWHLHHNPYVVLNLEASAGRMDWLDGSAPRFLEEYVGGAVYRPTSPVHRLTNIGESRYRNRLVEFKDLGEKRGETIDIGPGKRSIPGMEPTTALPDGRCAVLDHEHVRVWTITVPSGAKANLELADQPHVLAAITAPALDDDPSGATRYHEGGQLTLENPTDAAAAWYVVELRYLPELAVVGAAYAE